MPGKKLSSLEPAADQLIESAEWRGNWVFLQPLPELYSSLSPPTNSKQGVNNCNILTPFSTGPVAVLCNQ